MQKTESVDAVIATCPNFDGREPDYFSIHWVQGYPCRTNLPHTFVGGRPRSSSSGEVGTEFCRILKLRAQTVAPQHFAIHTGCGVTPAEGGVEPTWPLPHIT